MNPNYRLIQQVESTKFEKNVLKKDISLFIKFQSTYKRKNQILLYCVFILFSSVYSSFGQNPSSLLNDCTINQTWQEFEMDTTNLYPDWMKIPFKYVKIKQRQVRTDRVEVEIDNYFYNHYTINSGIYSVLTGLDNATIKEYITIFVLDSIAKTIPVFSDPDSILEIVVFQKDTCTFEKKCRIGIFDSTTANQQFEGGVCCTNGDPSNFESVAGMPILTDPVSGIRFIEYWYKQRCMGNFVCCEIVYQYKSNNDSIPKFVFFDGPTKRMHYQRACFNPFPPANNPCPDRDYPEEELPLIEEKRRCKSCQTPIHEE